MSQYGFRGATWWYDYNGATLEIRWLQGSMVSMISVVLPDNGMARMRLPR